MGRVLVDSCWNFRVVKITLSKLTFVILNAICIRGILSF